MSISEIILIFCSINQHSSSDPACYHYIRQCIEHQSEPEVMAYPRCSTQWTLNQNRRLGRCYNPDLKVNQPEVKGEDT